MIDSPAFIVAYTKWNVGSYEEGNADFIGRDNPFDIYIFFQKERELLVQKIDNYSFFQKKVMAGKNTGHFLANSFKAMKKEELRPQADTFYEKDRMVVLVSSVDHQLVSTVKIISRLDTLEYEYPADYSQNKRNLKTYRYKFLSYLDETATEYDKMNAKRENVVFRHK